MMKKVWLENSLIEKKCLSTIQERVDRCLIPSSMGIIPHKIELLLLLQISERLGLVCSLCMPSTEFLKMNILIVGTYLFKLPRY